MYGPRVACPLRSKCPTGSGEDLIRCPRSEPLCARCVFFDGFERDSDQHFFGRCKLGVQAGLYTCAQQACSDELPRRVRGPTPVEGGRPAGAAAGPVGVPPAALAGCLRAVLERGRVGGRAQLHPRFAGGTARVQVPGGGGAEQPIERFFQRLCAVKGAIGALERALDHHTGLLETDRAPLRRYLRSMEGSLTTFNLLFLHRGQGFKGSGRGS